MKLFTEHRESHACTQTCRHTFVSGSCSPANCQKQYGIETMSIANNSKRK